MDIEKLCDVRPCVLERNRPGFRAMMNRVGAPNHFFEILLHIVYGICTPKSGKVMNGKRDGRAGIELFIVNL
jgi:hypothetical protein